MQKTAGIFRSSVALAKVLKEHSVDLVDVSSGGNIHGAKIQFSMVTGSFFFTGEE
jgi:6-phosphogluconate dehydrogenase (decarboxylating)